MGYIIKDNQGLLVTRLTDTGRKKISEGNFNIAYFQIGDSEVNYDYTDINTTNGINSNYNLTNFKVLEPPYNAQNNSGVPQSTKNDIKYPFYLQGTSGITYGIPYAAPYVEEVYNATAPTGFFSATTTGCYAPIGFSSHTYNTEFFVYLTDNSFNGSTQNIQMSTAPSICSANNNGTISAGTIVAFFMMNNGTSNCNICYPSCSPFQIYKVTNYDSVTDTITLDRPLPGLKISNYVGSTRLYFYLSGASSYDLPTPQNYWNNSVINFESVCTPEDGIVKVWNMNIPWTEDPAGIRSYSLYKNYLEYNSASYIGTKEYYGYNNSNGQVFYNGLSGTTATTDTYYYNSFGEKVYVQPEEQKAVAIIHYTNNTIIDWYGEKIATRGYVDGQTTGEARNFEIHLPWVMWHKNTNCCDGLTLYIDPANYDGKELATPNYIQSTKNVDMNVPGIRYYNLWDTNTNPDGYPNRVGKVFPDDKVIVIDDEELVAAMTYISNRNYTLPSPKLGLITPGVCNIGEASNGLLVSGDTLWVTYAFSGMNNSTQSGWQGMHCNYYSKINGPDPTCQVNEQNVTVTFAGDFKCMTSGATSGFSASDLYVIAQKTTNGQRPNPANWKRISFGSQIQTAGFRTGNVINPLAMTALTFTITDSNYTDAVPYDLSTQIIIPQRTQTSNRLFFGDETFFYGTIKTDITATIYEMRYLINLPYNQFVNTSNPTYNNNWSTPFMTDIGLYDTDKNLLCLTKFQSPQIREGAQQVVVKLDF